ncbi:MAG TPA: hypothetical protein VF317_13530 [Dermatophilaceae bacterium]|jgi:hypothetical protein
MWWLLIWACLLLLSGFYVGARAWGLWGQTKELGSELAIAQRRLDAVQGQLEVLGERIGGPEELAVFSDVASARKERDRARAAGRHARQQRRAVSHPAWAKDVD